MQITDIPTKMPTVFAVGAGGGFIRPVPIPSQIGIQDGAASFTDGFPPDTFSPVGSGGVPPFGQDVNGLMNQVTAWLRWQQAGAPVPYDIPFQALVGGYPQGALVASPVTPGLLWLSTADNNTSNPDTGGANWLPVSLYGTSVTGDVKWRPTSETIPGWLKMNSTSVGSASSGATQFASAQAASVYAWLWNNFSNTLCPVGGGRGANAAADFAANKPIGILNMQGITPCGMDTMGGPASAFLSGVPVTFGSNTAAGSILGEALHSLILAELANHNHALTDPGHLHGLNDPGHAHGLSDPSHAHTANPNTTAGVTTPSTFSTAGGVAPGFVSLSINPSVTGITVNGATTGITMNTATTGISLAAAGGNQPHNNTQRIMTGTWYLKI